MILTPEREERSAHARAPAPFVPVQDRASESRSTNGLSAATRYRSNELPSEPSGANCRDRRTLVEPTHPCDPQTPAGGGRCANRHVARTAPACAWSTTTARYECPQKLPRPDECP